MEKLLTVVVPAYNAEKYLQKCLSSFIINSELSQSLEVLVVDDGSSDATAQIAEQFEDRYPQTFRVLSKENGGHGSVINTGAALAAGKYLKVVDADDWVITENLEKLLNFLGETDADAVVTAFHKVDESTGRTELFFPDCDCGKTYSLEDALQIFPRVYACFSFHGIFYKTEAYRRTGFLLSEKVFYEDNEFATVPFRAVETIRFFPESVYQYLIGSAGQSVSFRNQIKRQDDIRKVAVRILEDKNRFVPAGSPLERYYLMKLEIVVASYYSAVMVKNPDKKNGRALAARFREVIRNGDRQLYAVTDRKYKTLLLFNIIHFSPQIYQSLARKGLLRAVQGIWARPAQ